MGKKDEKVETVLHLLRKQSPLTLNQEKFCNKECVERFLKGKGDNVKRAAKQLLSCLSWRQSIEIERLGAEEFATELSDGVAYIAGHDGDFRPVIIFRFKNDYQKLRTQKQFSRLVAFTMETAISSMSRNAERSVVLLFDASFFRSSSAFANLLLPTLKIIGDNYPCRLYKAFIIDPPSFFPYILKGVRPFVELSTLTTVISSLDYDEQLDISHVSLASSSSSSSSCPRSASLRFDASSIKSAAASGSASSRFAFTVSHNSLKPWYLSFTDTSPLNAAVSTAASKISPISTRSLSFASPATGGLIDARQPACMRKSVFPSTPLPRRNSQHSMDRPETIAVKYEPTTVDSPSSSSAVAVDNKPARPQKLVVLADLNFNPPESDDLDSSSIQIPTPSTTRLSNEESNQDGGCKEVEPGEIEAKKISKVGKCRPRSKIEGSTDCGVDADGDQANQGVSASREEKISNLKMGLIHVARKMPRNAHAHFILGLMFQRLGQSQKAIPEYEKAEEILLGCEPEIARPELLLLVQMHHGQCLLLDGFADSDSVKEIEGVELEEILSKLKDSMKLDVRQATVWNTLGLMLLKAGCLMSAISVLSSLLALVPDNYDCLTNLGVAYLQSGDLELSAKCFQDLVFKDHNHPAALINYAAELLCKHSSTVAGAGANGGPVASEDQKTHLNVAKECLLAAVRADPKSAHAWVNLANSYYMMGDHRSSSKCLEKAAKLDPNCMATRFAVAVQRIKDAERSQDAGDQLSWAGNEMASVIREGESVPIDPPIAWAGLAMAHKAHHEIAAAFVADRNELTEMEERAMYSLKQAVSEDPEDAVRWHQLGLHCLCSQQYKLSQKYLKTAISRSRDCSYAWSNLGISLQLSDEQSEAEEVYKRALAVSTTEDQAHATFSNLGNLYRQKKQYELSKAMFSKALDLKPGYAPAYNNLGLVFVAERRWEEAKFCFEKALEADSLLDAAQSNLLKAKTMSRLCTCFTSSTVVQDS